MIKLKNILLEITKPSRYIGNCVDVGGSGKKEVCKFFPDATSMAQKVGDSVEDFGDSTQVDEEEFYRYVNQSIVPKKALKGMNRYFYISSERGIDIPKNEALIWYIYNEDQDIHYFFRVG